MEIWTDYTKQLIDKYHYEVVRYSTSAFVRAKLTETLAQRNMSTHIFGDRQHAENFLNGLLKGPDRSKL